MVDRRRWSCRGSRLLKHVARNACGASRGGTTTVEPVCPPRAQQAGVYFRPSPFSRLYKYEAAARITGVVVQVRVDMIDLADLARKGTTAALSPRWTVHRTFRAEFCVAKNPLGLSVWPSHLFPAPVSTPFGLCIFYYRMRAHQPGSHRRTFHHRICLFPKRVYLQSLFLVGLLKSSVFPKKYRTRIYVREPRP